MMMTNPSLLYSRLEKPEESHVMQHAGYRRETYGKRYVPSLEMTICHFQVWYEGFPEYMQLWLNRLFVMVGRNRIENPNAIPTITMHWQEKQDSTVLRLNWERRHDSSDLCDRESSYSLMADR